jgi:hypothetical protein
LGWVFAVFGVEEGVLTYGKGYRNVFTAFEDACKEKGIYFIGYLKQQFLNIHLRQAIPMQ